MSSNADAQQKQVAREAALQQPTEKDCAPDPACPARQCQQCKHFSIVEIWQAQAHVLEKAPSPETSLQMVHISSQCQQWEHFSVVKMQQAQADMLDPNPTCRWCTAAPNARAECF